MRLRFHQSGQLTDVTKDDTFMEKSTEQDNVTRYTTRLNGGTAPGLGSLFLLPPQVPPQYRPILARLVRNEQQRAGLRRDDEN